MQDPQTPTLTRAHGDVRQVQLAKDKLDAARLEDLTDSEETIAELKRRHDCDKLILLEENKKLALEVNKSNVFINLILKF